MRNHDRHHRDHRHDDDHDDDQDDDQDDDGDDGDAQRATTCRRPGSGSNIARPMRCETAS